MYEATAGIYEIRCIVSGRRYIGSSCNIKNRWKGHRSALKRGKHHSKQLQNAWDKYGKSAFEFNIIAACDDVEILHLVEQQYLDFAFAGEKPYNGARDAVAPSRGVSLPPERRAQVSAQFKGLKHSPEHVEARIAPLRGRKQSHEAIAKTVATRRANGSYAHSEETRKKMSAAKIGNKIRVGMKQPPDAIEIMRVKITGLKRTPEQKQRYSEAMKLSWVKRRQQLESAKSNGGNDVASE